MATGLTGPTIASTPNVALPLSSPPKPPESPLRTAARMIDKGVCVYDALAPPQCKHDFVIAHNPSKIAGQQESPLILQETWPTDSTEPPWKERNTSNGSAVAVAALSSPQPTLDGPLGKARMIDEEVCVYDTLAPPQCECRDCTENEDVFDGSQTHDLS
ncbi:hypothetical protein PCANC_07464 [Puccinia coronata f. sp. avenae]|uniref:Uncharacterized protein n=1 Tax=Puccinia coronata f. sp. avenae TaxID=200324 RepID=A0A2N5T494_9BASI|nr:hypothetical protein PCANC_07464 [Puccinia coronata f. sp. avenae]